MCSRVVVQYSLGSDVFECHYFIEWDVSNPLKVHQPFFVEHWARSGDVKCVCVMFVGFWQRRSPGVWDLVRT
jgi:hypothetical protein